MQDKTKNTLIEAIAASVLSTSAIKSLISLLKEKDDDPLLSMQDEYNEGYLTGCIKGFLCGYFHAMIEVAGRMKKDHLDKDFISKITKLDAEIIDQL